MKKTYKISILIIIIALTVCSLAVSAIARNNVSEHELLQIAILSDVHIGQVGQEDKLKAVLKGLKKISPYYKVLAFVGDITERGMLEQYDKFISVLDENMNPEAEKLIAIGNHEYYEGFYNNSLKISDSDLKKRFVKKTGMPGIYYDKWIVGYHFIILGGESSRISNPNFKDKAIISEEQYTWFEKTISENTENKKPIFIFLHQPIEGTVYGSENWGGGLRDGKLVSILKKYPQSILFSGHSHYTLDHPRSIIKDTFTMVSTGALFDMWTGNNNASDYISQGILVDVYTNRVEIKAREFSSGKWIKSFNINLNN